jgi:hypothetical protein
VGLQLSLVYKGVPYTYEHAQRIVYLHIRGDVQLEAQQNDHAQSSQYFPPPISTSLISAASTASITLLQSSASSDLPRSAASIVRPGFSTSSTLPESASSIVRPDRAASNALLNSATNPALPWPSARIALLVSATSSTLPVCSASCALLWSSASPVLLGSAVSIALHGFVASSNECQVSTEYYKS